MTSRIIPLVRSLGCRQRLLEGIDDIEREIIDYAAKHNLRTSGATPPSGATAPQSNRE